MWGWLYAILAALLTLVGVRRAEQPAAAEKAADAAARAGKAQVSKVEQQGTSDVAAMQQIAKQDDRAAEEKFLAELEKDRGSQ